MSEVGLRLHEAITAPLERTSGRKPRSRRRSSRRESGLTRPVRFGAASMRGSQKGRKSMLGASGTGGMSKPARER